MTHTWAHTDPATAYSRDDPRHLSNLEPAEVPDYIESGGTRWPNYLGATEEQIALADRETDTTVTPRDELYQESAVTRAVEQATENTNIGLDFDVPIWPIVGAIALVGGLIAVIFAIGQFAKGAGRGAVS